MCEFCVQHGEGKKWYLVMHNYSRELWAGEGRAEFMEDFGTHFEAKYGKAVALGADISAQGLAQDVTEVALGGAS